MLPKNPGINRVDVREHLQELVLFLQEVTRANPYILPLETPEEFVNFFTKEHHSDCYVWNDANGNFVGFLSLINMLEAVEVLSIWIRPDFQRQGYGKKMMRYAEEFAKKLGKKKMMLVTNPKNLPAISFYKSIGYSTVKKIDNFYGDGTPRLLLEKMLRS